jgi:hypothetical protein
MLSWSMAFAISQLIPIIGFAGYSTLSIDSVAVPNFKAAPVAMFKPQRAIRVRPRFCCLHLTASSTPWNGARKISNN